MTWVEIRARAAAFVREWTGETRERAESQSFWNEFFAIFGLSRRRLAAFEVPVHYRDRGVGRIDLFWKGVLLVEHKTAGHDLDRAYGQATDYFPGIPERDLPRYILVSDFARFRLYDLDKGTQDEFPLMELPRRIRAFAFVLGQTTREVGEQELANRKAADLMAGLHDALAADGYVGHDLEVLLVRLLFIFFADDTGIVEPRDHIHWYLTEMTSTEGRDLGTKLAEIFQVLDTPSQRRQRALDENLARLPYVNGALFRDSIQIPHFTAELRERLLECSAYDWSQVNPVIFGALFQSVGHIQERRRDQGMHYTSEDNIRKLIGPLFLDGIKAAFDDAGSDVRALKTLLRRIKEMVFLDPACGCGNFLVVAYRELRLLELAIHRKLLELGEPIQQQYIAGARGIDVDAFHGIEIEEFPAQIARTAMWLVDHQMNILAGDLIGEAVLRLPLTVSPHIVHGNALRLDWATIVPREHLTCILGNPPFIGKSLRSDDQTADMEIACAGVPCAGDLDYVCAWYVKAIGLMADTPIRCGFVSTNSICQGEQAGIIWPWAVARGLNIHFAHRTFRWANEARHNAHVFVVIIGFSLTPPVRGQQAQLFDYETPDAEAAVRSTGPHINPYLIWHDSNLVVTGRSEPLCQVPAIVNGNKPVDGGQLLLSPEEKDQLIARSPGTARFIKPFISAHEFINGERRYCLWLTDEDRSWTDEQAIMERVDRVRAFRLASKKADTRRIAAFPHLFGQIRQPSARYILIPRHSSENRRFIPMGYCDASDIIADSSTAIPRATMFHFGVLNSDMHMAWVRHVCGRLKSDFRYSNEIVYNNFPWPETDPEREAAIAAAAQRVLDARAPVLANGRDTLATIYAPDSMPRELTEAHNVLSRLVDRAYAPRRGFAGDRERMELLLTRYTALIGRQEVITEVATPQARRRRVQVAPAGDVSC